MRLIGSPLLALALASSVPATAAAAPVQAPELGPDTTIDASTRSRVIQGVIQRLREGYVFPERLPRWPGWSRIVRVAGSTTGLPKRARLPNG